MPLYPPATTTGYTPGGTDVAVADGGTGASTASGARTNLGVVIGTDVRAQGSGDPTSLAASVITVTDAGSLLTASEVEAALQELALKGIGYSAHGNTGSTETFSALTGWHSATLNAACTFTLTAAPTGTSSNLLLELLQDGTGGWAITLPASVANKTALEAAQVTTLSTTSFLALWSRDGGTTWYGAWVGVSSADSDATVTFTDITTNNASTTKHGFLKKLSNVSTDYMSGTGVWSTPSGGSGSVTTVKDEGTNLSTAVVSLDFVGAGVTATGTTAVTVTIPGSALATAGPTNVGANASIGNGSYADIVSQAITAGTWLVLFDMQVSGTSGRVITYHIVNDAATEIKVFNTTIGSSGQEEASGFCVITAAGSDHAKLQASSTGAGDVARGTTAWTNPATQMYAIQVA